jgi:carboxyl-terminal processing protease
MDELAKDEVERLREADLDRHLSNGKAEEQKRETEAKVAPEAKAVPETKAVPEAKVAPKPGSKPAKPENEEDKNKKRESPAEFGSSDDLLLVQAISYIKENAGKRATAKVEN